jgi:NitT/TauT family transport system substrate-binding protein
MKVNRFILLVVLYLVLGSFVASACTQSTAAPAGAETPVAQATQPPAASSGEQPTLKIAVLPILDALPMYVAQQEGLFEKNGIKVEFIPAASAAERDQIFASGQVDGIINDSVSTLFYNQDQTQIQIVRMARTATSDFPQYQVLASPKSGFTSVQDLKGVEIGISQGTVIEYITERLLEAEGFKPEDIKTIAVPKIADRMSLLDSGELKAATLPDPLSSLASQAGAVLMVDDTRHPEYGYSVYSFRKKLIDENPAAVRGFLAAIEAASEEINAEPTKWDNLLTEQKLVPAPLVGKYKLPVYPSASVPTQAQWDDVLAWAKAKGLVKSDVSYQESVNSGLLP